MKNFSIKRLATVTGFTAGEIKQIFDLPIKSVCKAKTFEKAYKAFSDAKEGSDTELAAYRQMLKLFPERLESVKTAEQAKAVWEIIEDCGQIDMAVALLTRWIGLTKTLNQTAEVLVAGVPDTQLIKSIFVKMTEQLKTTGRKTALKAFALLKNDDLFEIGLVFAQAETKEFLSAIAELYTTEEKVPASQ